SRCPLSPYAPLSRSPSSCTRSSSPGSRPATAPGSPGWSCSGPRSPCAHLSSHRSAEHTGCGASPHPMLTAESVLLLVGHQSSPSPSSAPTAFTMASMTSSIPPIHASSPCTAITASITAPRFASSCPAPLPGLRPPAPQPSQPVCTALHPSEHHPFPGFVVAYREPVPVQIADTGDERVRLFGRQPAHQPHLGRPCIDLPPFGTVVVNPDRVHPLFHHLLP